MADSGAPAAWPLSVLLGAASRGEARLCKEPDCVATDPNATGVLLTDAEFWAVSASRPELPSRDACRDALSSMSGSSVTVGSGPPMNVVTRGVRPVANSPSSPSPNGDPACPSDDDVGVSSAADTYTSLLAAGASMDPSASSPNGESGCEQGRLACVVHVCSGMAGAQAVCAAPPSAPPSASSLDRSAERSTDRSPASEIEPSAVVSLDAAEDWKEAWATGIGAAGE